MISHSWKAAAAEATRSADSSGTSLLLAYTVMMLAVSAHVSHGFQLPHHHHPTTTTTVATHRILPTHGHGSRPSHRAAGAWSEVEEGEEEEKDAFPSLSSVSVARAESPAELVEESVFVVRSPDDSDVSVVECKRRDGRPLGHGLASDPDEDRRAFRFATADPAVVVHVREIPFSYGKLGGSIWYAAVAFAQYLASNPSLLEGKRVLELGAGLGLPGLVAAKTTGVHVTLSEFGYEGEVNGRLIEEAGEQRLIPSALLDNLRFNIALNNVTAKDDEQYDLLIGSDLVNWEDDVGPLISTLQHFLSATEGSKAIISLSQNNRQALPTFLDLIEHEFVTVDVQNQTVTHFEEYPLLLITLTM